MDPLAPLLSRFRLNAAVFFSGSLCGMADFDTKRDAGILHVLRRGRLRVVQRSGATFELTQPTLLFYRQSLAHRFEADATDRADLVCANVDFGATLGNPVFRGLPELLRVPLADMAGAEPTLGLLFDEAFANRAGRQAGVDRLMEYFVVLLLRHTIDARLITLGLAAGLADARLAKSITAMHDQPELAWSLEGLAQVAGMSRARFAAAFRETVGTPPLDYLTDWRVSVAQTLLMRGRPLKSVAPAVGYLSPAAFARVFSKRVGSSAIDWAAAQRASAASE